MSAARVSGYLKAGENLWLNQASGIYYVRKSFKRHKIPDLFQTTGETQIRKARARADELIQAHLIKELAPRKGERTVGEIIAEVLETVTPTRRPGTQAMHRGYFAELDREWGKVLINDVSLSEWARWLKGFRRRKNRKGFSDYQKHMNLLLRYAYKNRYASHLLTLPSPDGEHRAKFRVYSQVEIRALWDAMTDDLRDQFVLSFECFMRLREMLYLTWDRVNLESGVVTLRPEDVKTGSKTGKGRSFKLSPRALERLRARKAWSYSKHVFPSPSDRHKPRHQNQSAWEGAKAKAGIRGRARWHDLRHTALTMSLLDRKYDALLISEYAGVSVRTIQQVYLHSTAEKTASVAEALDIFGNLGSEVGVKNAEK